MIYSISYGEGGRAHSVGSDEEQLMAISFVRDRGRGVKGF